MTQDHTQRQKGQIENALIALFDAHGRIYSEPITGDDPDVRGSQLDRREKAAIGVQNTAIDQVLEHVDRIDEQTDRPYSVIDILSKMNLNPRQEQDVIKALIQNGDFNSRNFIDHTRRNSDKQFCARSGGRNSTERR